MDASTPAEMVVFRCDGGVESGLGHVSRCVGLAEAFAERSIRSLFVGSYSPHALALLDAAAIENIPASARIGSREDSASLVDICARRHPRGIVIDSYVVDSNYLRALSPAAPVVVIDDFANLAEYPCRAVLNFTVGALHREYPATAASLLLGPEYMLLRRAIRGLRRKALPQPRAARVLVALGGVDRHGLSGRVLEALARVAAELEVRVVIRPGHQNQRRLETWGRAFKSCEISVGLDSLADPYDWAHVCISGGGLIKYETAFLGLPTGVLSQSEGEEEDTRRYVQMGLVVDLGGPHLSDRPLLGPLEALLGSHELRCRLHDASSRVFGVDPTARAADELLALLQQDFERVD